MPIEVVEVTSAVGISVVEVVRDDGITVVEVQIPGLGGSGGGSSDFLGLTDTPDNYIGQTGRVVAVNVAENALEFVSPSAGTQTPWGQDINAANFNLLNLGYVDFNEIATPAAPAANAGRLFLRDNGSGITQVCIRFANGNVLVIGQDT